MLLSLLLAAAASDGKIMATDDWSPATIVAVGSPSPTSPETYLLVQTGDLDGDGLPDDAYLKLHCADGKLTQAWYQVKGPRDSATGMATGKRMHKPFTLVKEWGAASPELAAVKPTYDVKMLKTARMSAVDDWWPITLAHTDGLCPAAGAAARAIVKSKSNITNN
jgi:hypothetical protein